MRAERQPPIKPSRLRVGKRRDPVVWQIGRDDHAPEHVDQLQRREGRGDRDRRLQRRFVLLIETGPDRDRDHQRDQHAEDLQPDTGRENRQLLDNADRIRLLQSPHHRERDVKGVDLRSRPADREEDQGEKQHAEEISPMPRRTRLIQCTANTFEIFAGRAENAPGFLPEDPDLLLGHFKRGRGFVGFRNLAVGGDIWAVVRRRLLGRRRRRIARSTRRRARDGAIVRRALRRRPVSERNTQHESANQSEDRREQISDLGRQWAAPLGFGRRTRDSNPCRRSIHRNFDIATEPTGTDAPRGAAGWRFGLSPCKVGNEAARPQNPDAGRAEG